MSGHCGHGLPVGTGVRRLRVHVQLLDAGAALTDDVAEAVGSRVATADDHDPRFPGGDLGGGHALARDAAVLLHEVVHREVDATEVAPGYLDVTGPIGADSEDHRVESLAQLRGRDVDTDVVAGLEGDALGLEQTEPAIEDPFLHLEVGDAVPKQPTDSIGPLEHRDVVPGAVQLLCGGEAGRPGPDDRDAPAGAMRRWLGTDPPLIEGAIDDRLLDLLDRHRIVVDRQDACRLAGRGAEPAGELRKVVGGVQSLYRRTASRPVRRGRSIRG